MDRIYKAKIIYKIVAVVLLSCAIGYSAFLIHKGIEAKNQPVVLIAEERKPDIAERQRDEFQLVIGKIGITSPITIDVDGANKQEYNSALQNGVAHLKGSALPGRFGNTFIFGHSSYYRDDPGEYKEIFAELNQMINGDLVEIHYGDNRYIYKIIGKKIVDPNDVYVANQNHTLKQLTLMTCWPIGTTDQRLVVVSELVSS
jgi:LPXTG-site transpeptidase (sortase) family protein